jgi:hypothetical protein
VPSAPVRFQDACVNKHKCNIRVARNTLRSQDRHNTSLSYDTTSPLVEAGYDPTSTKRYHSRMLSGGMPHVDIYHGLLLKV